LPDDREAVPEGSHLAEAARTFRLVLEYDGARFAGWQRQPEQRTVQGELQRAVEVVTRGGLVGKLAGASRTDAGVHARGQVASFSAVCDLAPGRLLRSLNALLPEDAAVSELTEVEAGFHARHSARGKHYRYQLLLRPARSPGLAGSAWHVSGGRGGSSRLDLEAMQRAVSQLEGRRDFRTLECTGSPQPDRGAESWTCTLHKVALEPDPEVDGLWRLDVVGDRFLYKMVRTLAGTVAAAGSGDLDPDALPELLARGDRRAAGPTAPAHGLCLMRVSYHPTLADLPIRGDSLAQRSSTGEGRRSSQPLHTQVVRSRA
jgi:tRNA pseudouridine38-40 synthase